MRRPLYTESAQIDAGVQWFSFREGGPMNLLEMLSDHHRIVSVIGMAKNAGKTVTLNELIDQATGLGWKLGLTSIGRDGERQDVVTCTEKPTIYAEAGTLLATAEAMFECSEAKLEILESTDFNTPLGKVLIARTLTPGNVQLAGPCSSRAIRGVSERMLAYGARLVFVDGALDRISSASPAVADGAVLSTGAVLSRDMNKVIEQTVHQVRLFQLPVVDEPIIREVADKLEQNRGVVLVEESEDCFQRVELELKTALNAGRHIADSMNSRTRYVILGGALVTKTLTDILSATRNYKHCVFVVRDATRIFIGHRDWLHLMKAGVQVAVADPVEILAVTVNPYAPAGYYFEPHRFLEQMQEFLKPIPVYDVVHGGGSQ